MRHFSTPLGSELFRYPLGGEGEALGVYDPLTRAVHIPETEKIDLQIEGVLEGKKSIESMDFGEIEEFVLNHELFHKACERSSALQLSYYQNYLTSYLFRAWVQESFSEGVKADGNKLEKNCIELLTFDRATNFLIKSSHASMELGALLFTGGLDEYIEQLKQKKGTVLICDSLL